MLAFEPGKRVLFTFQMGQPLERPGEVEINFEPLSVNTCRVTLIHSHWEGYAEPEIMRGRFASGWEFVFNDAFGNYVGLA